MPDGTVYLYWDCPSCNTKKIRGDKKQCPKCGKEKSVECYLVEGEPDITDPAELAAAHAGADWTCTYCQTVNANTDKVCSDCGTPRGTGKHHKVIAYDPGAEPTASTGDQELEDHEIGEAISEPRLNIDLSQGVESWKPSNLIGSYNLRKVVIAFVAVVALIAVAGGLYYMLKPYDVGVSVSGVSWERSIEIQKYDWVSERNQSGFPDGSRNQRQEWEVVGHHQEVAGYHTEYDTVCHSVADGETCSYTDLGNGRADRSCTTNYRQECQNVPRTVTDYKTVDDYGWVFYFEIQRWIHSRTPKSSGDDREPYWPGFELATGDVPEREASRDEKYTITYRDGEGKSYSRNVDFEEWSTYNLECDYTLTTNRTGAVLKVIPEC